MPRKTVALLASLTLLGATAAAQAQSLDRVEVMGQKVRTDVTATCAALPESLTHELAPAVARHQTLGTYTVTFELQGREVGDVRMQSMPFEYRRHVRSALRYAGCADTTAQAQPQRFGFRVDVVAEPRGNGAPAQMAVALRALP